jgi:acyl-coenzyme A thioesterase PaaI-like protein
MDSSDMDTDSSGTAPGGQAPSHWTRREMKGIPASLGAVWTHRDDTGWHYAVQLDESHCNSQGFIHGGVLMSFMDHGLSLVIWEASGRAMTSTVHLDSHFLAAVRPPAFVELESQILRQGRNTIFARGILRVAGTEIMDATGVWSIAAGSQS